MTFDEVVVLLFVLFFVCVAGLSPLSPPIQSSANLFSLLSMKVFFCLPANLPIFSKLYPVSFM